MYVCMLIKKVTLGTDMKIYLYKIDQLLVELSRLLRSAKDSNSYL